MQPPIHIYWSMADRLVVTVSKDEAITDEHAISLAAAHLTAEGYGDAELRGVGKPSRQGHYRLIYDYS
jgi:hypothetical protein